MPSVSSMGHTPSTTRFARFDGERALYRARMNSRWQYRSPRRRTERPLLWISPRRREMIRAKDHRHPVPGTRFHFTSTKKSNWSTGSQPVFTIAKKVLLFHWRDTAATAVPFSTHGWNATNSLNLESGKRPRAYSFLCEECAARTSIGSFRRVQPRVVCRVF